MRELDMEMVIILAAMSLIAAIGIVAFIAVITGMCILEIGLLYVWGIIFGFAGIIFGVLILRHFAK